MTDCRDRPAGLSCSGATCREDSRIKTITVTVQPSSNPEATLLAPAGYDDGHERPCRLDLGNCAKHRALNADFLDQPALELWPERSDQPVELRYGFSPSSSCLPATVWQPQSNRYTEASDRLITDVGASVDTALPVADQIRQLITKAEGLFSYGHNDGRFYDGEQTIPMVCGTTRGSCVDINTWLLAAARSLNIPVQYVAGYWFHPQKTVTHDMHCWLLFRIGDEVLHWDLAHHMKWGVQGREPGRNPAGGRRVAMSLGRGLRFAASHGDVTISHFSEPVWLLPDGSTEKSQLTATIEE